MNDLPGIFAGLARSAGHEVRVDSSAMGGYSLEQHVSDRRTQEKLESARWDFVVLQEKTGILMVESTRNAQMVPAVRALQEKARSQGAQTVLVGMWASTGAVDEAGLAHFASEQARVTAALQQLAQDLELLLAPVGPAWERSLRQRPELGLWGSDNQHASRAGTYLMACVLYATIYQQSPAGLSFTAGLPEETAQFLQEIAEETTEGAPAVTQPSGRVHFAKSEQAFASVPTWEIGLADLDGDGDLDAVFANGQAHDSEVWLNDGRGFFTDTGQQLGRYGHGLDVGDLDGDGDPDLIISTHRDSAPTRVYLNDGKAVFQELEGAFAVNIGYSAHLLDIDGDGDLDAVGEAADAADVYLNDGTGRFSASETSFPLTTVWGDLDSDGDVDLLIKEEGVGYSVRLNDGQGNLSQHWTHADPEAMQMGDMALGDVDGDGDLDVVITNGHFQSTSHPGMVFINDGMGRFSDSGQRLSAVRNAGVGLGDLDGDGDLDLVLTDYMEPCQSWLNDGSGGFGDSGFRFGEGQFYRHVHLDDLDGDGDLDVFLATFGTGQGPNEIWFNSASNGN
jgi:hypothetical protein